MIYARYRTFGVQRREKKTVIYTHVPNRGGKGAKSPVGELLGKRSGMFYGKVIARVVNVLRACNHKTNSNSGMVVLYRSFAAEECYKETI